MSVAHPEPGGACPMFSTKRVGHESWKLQFLDLGCIQGTIIRPQAAWTNLKFSSKK